MKIFLKNRFLILAALLISGLYAKASDLENIIPFDTLTKKYTYHKEITAKDIKFKDLYKRGKEWSEKSFFENKYQKEEKSGKLESKGTFSFSAAIKKGDIKIPFIYTVTYTASTLFVDGKSSISITDIVLSNKDAKGKTITQTLENFEKRMSNFGKQKEASELFVKESFIEINKKISPILSEGEKAFKKMNETK